MLTAILNDEQTLFSNLERQAVRRSLPRQKDLTPEAAAALRQVLEDGKTLYKLQPGLRKCIEMGWVHTDREESLNGFGDDIICYFPTNIHKKYYFSLISPYNSLLTQCRFVEYYLCAMDPKPFPAETFPSLTVLCEAVLRSFSRKNLRLSVDRSTPLTRKRPPEAQFQDEFYRAFHAVVGHDIAISSEWACNSDGRVDFLITQPGWGVELLRDGDRLAEHCSRFRRGGSYSTLIRDGVMKDWLVLDCRHSKPRKYCMAPTAVLSYPC